MPRHSIPAAPASVFGRLIGSSAETSPASIIQSPLFINNKHYLKLCDYGHSKLTHGTIIVRRHHLLSSAPVGALTTHSAFSSFNHHLPHLSYVSQTCTPQTSPIRTSVTHFLIHCLCCLPPSLSLCLSHIFPLTSTTCIMDVLTCASYSALGQIHMQMTIIMPTY